MKRFSIEKEQNFRIWKSKELVDKYVNIIITFINNGILEDINSQDLFKEIFEEYLKQISYFYYEIKKIRKTKGLKNNQEIDFNLDFKNRIYEITAVDFLDFSIQNFAIQNLNLQSDFEEKVRKVVLI